MDELPSLPPHLYPNGVPKQVTDTRPPLADVITSLELATQTLRILPSSADPARLFQAYNALRNAHHQIGSLLTRFETLDSTLENSSASNGGGTGGREDELMADEDGASEEADSLKIIQKVEEGMRECALQPSKRLKRPLSPYWVPQRSADDDVSEMVLFGEKERLRAFDLIFQFHG
ncbi:hypothetical protein ACLOJK_032123 [Asimina triloba]